MKMGFWSGCKIEKWIILSSSSWSIRNYLNDLLNLFHHGTLLRHRTLSSSSAGPSLNRSLCVTTHDTNWPPKLNSLISVNQTLNAYKCTYKVATSISNKTHLLPMRRGNEDSKYVFLREILKDIYEFSAEDFRDLNSGCTLYRYK